MLVLTDNATAVIRALGDRPERPDGSGLRITSAADTDTQGLRVTPASTPNDGDQVMENAGARVFLDPGAAIMLEDKVLDARVEPDGAVQFLVGNQ
jgi:iron-sulfur cluster assembly protein